MKVRPHIFALFLLITLVCLALAPLARAQTMPVPDTSRTKTNNAVIAPADTIGTDSISLAPAQKGDIETTIIYSARDSIRSDIGSRKVYLFGDAKINYGTMTLEAAYIEIDWATNVITATPYTDSTGKEIGVPVFKDEPELYTAKKIAYNFKTRKGRISGVVTQQGEGYIHGEAIKKNERDELYVSQAQYTTCNLEHPHFYFNIRKMKIIPEKRIYTGPFNLVVGDVPTPLGFAFGLFPMPKKNASGVIIPTFGESRRGFFLRNGGVYWAVNDYIGTRILGEVYSLGGYGVQMDNQYFKRYSYNGRLNLRYNFRPASAAIDVAPNRREKQTDFWIDWQHTPIVKRGGRFSASVNAGTSSFNQNNSWNTQNYLSATFNSNINYQKQIENSPFNYTIAARQSLNTQTREQTFTLPDFNFNMSSIQPLANVGRSGAWYRNTRLSYSMVARNQITNRISNPGGVFQDRFTGVNDSVFSINQNTIPLILDNSRSGIQHTIPISTNFKAFKHFTVSPNFNYSETWYGSKMNYAYQPDLEKVRIDTSSGFNRVYNYSTGVNVNTRAYGIFYVKGKKLEAIRHMISPNVGFAYSPDFGSNKYGHYQEVQTNNAGQFQNLSRYNGYLFGTPVSGEQARLNFAISNNLEAKVRAKQDTSGTTQFEKMSIIDNLGISSSYNLAADSFQLSEVQMDLRTTLFKVLGINLNASYDPYFLNLTTGRRENRLMISDSFRPLRLTRASLATTFNLNPQVVRRQQPVPVTTPEQEAIVRNINTNPDLYVDFTVPWSLAVNYTLNYSRRVRARADIFEEVSEFANALNFNGDVKLTDNWKIGFFSGYDFDNKEITYTTLNIYRDLHCWEMAVSWIPFGPRQSYFVTINAKASILQDLKLQRNRSWYDQ